MLERAGRSWSSVRFLSSDEPENVIVVAFDWVGEEYLDLIEVNLHLLEGRVDNGDFGDLCVL